MSSVQRSPKSPILAAVGISLAIAAGSIIGTLDMATVEDVATGKNLTRPLAEAQQRNTLAIAALENTVGAITRDIDFVAARFSSTIRRGEDQTSDRFAQLDAEIAALKDKIAGIQHARLAPVRASEPQRDVSGDVTGLRSSLNDLSLAHSGAVAAITRRLDRIEVKVGLTTDVVSSVSDASAQKSRAPSRRRSRMCRTTARCGAERRSSRARPHLQPETDQPAGRAAAPVPTAGLTFSILPTCRTLPDRREFLFTPHDHVRR